MEYTFFNVASWDPLIFVEIYTKIRNKESAALVKQTSYICALLILPLPNNPVHNPDPNFVQF